MKRNHRLPRAERKAQEHMERQFRVMVAKGKDEYKPPAKRNWCRAEHCDDEAAGQCMWCGNSFCLVHIRHCWACNAIVCERCTCCCSESDVSLEQLAKRKELSNHVDIKPKEEAAMQTAPEGLVGRYSLVYTTVYASAVHMAKAPDHQPDKLSENAIAPKVAAQELMVVPEQRWPHFGEHRAAYHLSSMQWRCPGCIITVKDLYTISRWPSRCPLPEKQHASGCHGIIY